MVYISLYLKRIFFFFFFTENTILGLVFLIHFDNLSFKPLVFRVITDMVGLVSAILIAVFYLLSCFLFLSFWSTIFLYFVVLNEHFILFHFPLSSNISYTSFFNFVSDCPRVCNIHLQLKQVHFQVTLLHE